VALFPASEQCEAIRFWNSSMIVFVFVCEPAVAGSDPFAGDDADVVAANVTGTNGRSPCLSA